MPQAEEGAWRRRETEREREGDGEGGGDGEGDGERMREREGKETGKDAEGSPRGSASDSRESTVQLPLDSASISLLPSPCAIALSPFNPLSVLGPLARSPCALLTAHARRCRRAHMPAASVAAPTLFQQFAEHEARRSEAQAAREAAEARAAAAAAEAAAPAKKKAAPTAAAPPKVKTVAYETLEARLSKVRRLGGAAARPRAHAAGCMCHPARWGPLPLTRLPRVTLPAVPI